MSERNPIPACLSHLEQMLPKPLIPLPMINHCIEEPENADLLDAAIQRFAADLNGLPKDLKLSFVASVLLTGCGFHTDPIHVFEMVIRRVAEGLELAHAKPEGRA